EVETVESSFEIPASALPADAPVFNHKGVSGTSFTYDYTAGLGGTVTDAILSFVSRPGLETLTLETDCPYLTWVGVPTSIELLGASEAQQNTLETNGIRWIVEDGSPFGCVDFSGAVSNVRQGIPFDASDPVSAVFTVTAVDKAGKQSKAVFSLKAVPVQATITAADYDIWGWKILRPVAHLKDVSAPSGTNIKLQYSTNGSSWTTVDAVDINGSTVTFKDIYGLTAGTDYRFRTILNDDEGNTSDPSIIRTEDPAQAGNSGFEEYTSLTHTTKVALLSDFNVTWWQLYSGSDRWWAVNSPVTLRDGTVPAAYQDFKTYPTVALTTDGAYSGNSLIIATIFIDDYGSKIMAGSNSNAGEIFIGTANDLCEGNWAKTSEGHSFPSRPSALEFQYKFTRGGSTKAFIANVEILDADSVVIGSGSLQSSDEKSSWTKGNIPIQYTVNNRKAASIRMSFRSSTDGKESVKTVLGTTVKTLSGSHEIHCGNLLYLDNIELKYE
ncbi:MAG: PCMD domain-containing protein, partial [Bacteroidales bacterium]|nr:PCMD domain-containing protein [Bacteroidales bacterium]